MSDPTELMQMSFSVGEVIQIVGGVFLLYKGYGSLMAKISANHLEVIKQVGDITQKVNQKIAELDKDLTEKITVAKEDMRKDFEEKLEKARIELDGKIDTIRTDLSDLKIDCASSED